MQNINLNFEFTLASSALPKKSGKYLCYSTVGYFVELSYSTRWKCFNCLDDDEDDSTKIKIYMWAELPEIEMELEGEDSDE